MKRETSVYLDLLRFSAAMCVFLFHAHSYQAAAPILWRFGTLGPPAVLVFFVLSGYVIAYTTSRSHTRAGDYAVARLARLLSVTLAALALTAVLDAFGRMADPSMYVRDPPPDFLGVARALVFANELWGNNVGFGTISPYWSLGYEVPFYVLYGIAVFTRGRTRILALAASAAVVGPRILIMYPLWLMGVLAYAATRQDINKRVAGCMLLASVCGIAVFITLADGLDVLNGLADTYSLRQVVFSYVLCLLFALHIAAFSVVAEHMSLLGAVQRPVQWLAGATLSLYLFHKPILVFLSALHVLPENPAASAIVVVGGTLAACFALAEVTERKRLAWRAALNGLVRRVRANASVVTD